MRRLIGPVVGPSCVRMTGRGSQKNALTLSEKPPNGQYAQNLCGHPPDKPEQLAPRGRGQGVTPGRVLF